MSSLQRRVGILILITLLLLINSIMLFAQDSATETAAPDATEAVTETPVATEAVTEAPAAEATTAVPSAAITILGSGISAPLMGDLAQAAGVEAAVNVTGTNDGFAAFCRGEADVTTGTRSISAEEEAACAESGVSFLEFVVGYDVTAVIGNPATAFGTCLTGAQLNALFAPSATAAQWSQVPDATSDFPVSLFVPADNTTPYALLDSVVEGVGLRADLTPLADNAAIIAAVSSTEGGLGIVSLPSALAAGDQVRLLELSTTTAGCAAPTVEAAAGRTYSAAYTLYAYANSAQVEPIKPLFSAVFGADSAAAYAARSLVAPPADILASDQSILNEVKAGRQFSKDVTAFNIPTNLVGTINIAGAASGSDYVTAVTGQFVQVYAGVTLNQKVTGEPDAVRQLCNGEVDMINSFVGLDEEAAGNCAANNIPTETFELGRQAVVLLGNGDFLTCLKTDEIAAVWGAAAEKTVTNWNQVNASFPDLPITLVAPTVGDPYGDLLMLTASGQSLPTREDFAETKASAAYRITAIGNVAGGLTYMSWADYNRLSPENQAKAQPIAVDAGNGCIAPSEATLADGTYALSRPLELIVNRISMARQDVQSLLWYIASDENYSLLTSNGYSGLNFAALPDLRDRLQKAFVQGASDAADAAARAAAATPEATAEATPEATAAS